MGFLLSPAFLLPFNLVTPYIFIFGVGLSVFEILIFISVFSLVINGRIKAVEAPRVLLIFLFLFILGNIGSALNGLRWGIPFGAYELLLIGYKVALVWCAFQVGYYYRQSMFKIISSKYFFILVLVLSAFAVTYPFLNPDQRYAVMKIFYLPGNLKGISRLLDPRFPGLGINANVYSFIVYSFFLFSLNFFFKHKTSWLLSFLLFLIILTAGSKTVVAMCVFSFLVILSVHGVKIHSKNLRLIFSKRIFKISFLIGVILILFIVFLFSIEGGKFIYQSIVIFERFEDVLFNADSGKIGSFSGRFILWEMGLERVKLAPFFGIALHRFIIIDSVPLYFSTSHNEFINLWMDMGLLGLLAHCFIIFYAIRINIKNRTGIVWILFYFSLIIQMFFDGAFEYIRFLPMWFMIFSLNLSEIHMGYSKRRTVTSQI
jgi:hypothetical protein